MPNKINKNCNRFVTVRSKATLAADTIPLASDFAQDQRFDASGADYILFYWTGTTPSGTVDFTVYMWDADTSVWVKGDTVATVAVGTLAKLPAYGASNAVLTMANVGSGTNIKVNAFGWDD